MEAKLPEKTLYDGKYIQLVQQDKWEFCRRKNISGIVVIAAVTDDGKILLVEQFRPAIGKPVIELPAGLAGDEGDKNEKLEIAARRELCEETGYEAKEMKVVAEGPPSAGLSDEVLTLFVARGLKKTGEVTGDGSEDITLHEVKLDDLPDFLERKKREGMAIDLKVFAGVHFLQV